MAVRERDFMKAPDADAAAPARGNWLARLNEFGERHAKVIITLSTGLIVLTVLLFAKYFYDKSLNERAEQELAQEESSERLREMKEKYRSVPAVAKIVYRLANRYYSEGKLEAARNEYQEFLSRFPNHPLQVRAEIALASLEHNLRYERDQKEQRLKEHTLQSHPTRLAQAKDDRLKWAPLPPAPLPTAELRLAGGEVKIELYEDDAPNAVAAFVKLCEEGYFTGVKFDLVNTDERVQTQKKAEGAPDYTLAVENSPRPAEAGSLVLVKKEGAEENLPGEFQILLKPLPDLKGATVFGKVTDGLPTVQNLKKDDALLGARVTWKRDHPYEPKKK